MPKTKSYEDAVDSIHSFIFSQAKKTPDKAKPVKLTGVDSNNEVLETISGILENPLLFINQTTQDSFNEVINTPAEELSPGMPRDNKARTLVEGEKGEKTLLERQFEKLEASRKAGKVTWANTEILALFTEEWAKEVGLDKQTQKAIRNIGEKYAEKKKAQELVARSKELLDKNFGEGGEKLAKEELEERYGVTSEEASQIYEDASKEYKESPPNSNQFQNLLNNIQVYGLLERNEMHEKAKDAQEAGDKEKSRNYRKIADFADFLSRGNAIDLYRQRQLLTLRRHQESIKKIKNSQDPEKSKKIKEIQAEAKKIQRDVRFASLQNSAKNLGEMEGMLASTKAIYEYSGGDFLGDLAKGDFFDEEKSKVKSLQPVTDFTLGNGVKIKVEKEQTNSLRKTYDEKMTGLYYSNPLTLLKSLVTGEAFGYRAYKSLLSFTKEFKTQYGIDLEVKKLLGEDSEGYMRSLAENLNQEQLDALERFLLKNKSLLDAAYLFNTGSRIWKWTGGFLRTGAVGKLTSSVTGNLPKGLKGGNLGKLIPSGMIGSIIKPFKAIAETITSGKLREKMEKSFLKDLRFVAVLSVFGVFGVFLLLLSILAPATTSFAHIAPGQVLTCEPDLDIGLDPSETPEDWIDLPDLPPGQTCLLGTLPKYNCTQSPFGTYSHTYLNAIDIGHSSQPPWDGTFYAPQFCGNGGTCTITEYSDYACAGNPKGGGKQLYLTAQYGSTTYVFRLVHVISALSVGSNVSAGQAIARNQTVAPPSPNCWGGAHLHLEIKIGTTNVHPCGVLMGFGCALDNCNSDFNPGGSCISGGL